MVLLLPPVADREERSQRTLTALVEGNHPLNQPVVALRAIASRASQLREQRLGADKRATAQSFDHRRASAALPQRQRENASKERASFLQLQRAS